MNIVVSRMHSTYESKHSRFVCYLFPFSGSYTGLSADPVHCDPRSVSVHDCENMDLFSHAELDRLGNGEPGAVEFDRFKNDALSNLKSEHRRATHFCYAFRYMNSHDQIIEGFSDCKEPRGSAGVPILNVIKGQDVINILAVCVRYFGGIKLGIGGLVRAYGASTLLSLECARREGGIVPFVKLGSCVLSGKVGYLDSLLRLVKKHRLAVTKRKFDSDTITLLVEGERAGIECLLRDYNATKW